MACRSSPLRTQLQWKASKDATVLCWVGHHPRGVIRLPHSILPLPHRRSPAVGSWRPTATGLAVLSKENLEERLLPTSAWGLQQVLTILRKVLLWCHFIQGNRGLERVQNFLRDTAEKLENFPDSDSKILNHSAFNCISIYLYLSYLSTHRYMHTHRSTYVQRLNRLR